MIRINLLSAGPKGRQAKPQYDVRAQVLLGVGLLVITLSACWWYSASLDDEIATRQTERSEKEKQVAQLKEQVKQVSDFELRKNNLKTRTALSINSRSRAWVLSKSWIMSVTAWNH